MSNRTRLTLAGAGLVLLLLASGARALDVPKLQARVTDLAGVLTTEQATVLEERLKQFEASDSTQIAVLIIPSLEGEVLEDYSVRVATAWRLGQKGRDNGALLFISMKERKIRIEVGYGLEPTLTDALSSRIIRNEIAPRFRDGDFPGGIEAGVSGVMRAVRGAYQASPGAEDHSQRRDGSGNGYQFLVFLLAPMLWVLGSTGKWGGSVLGGGAGLLLIYWLLGVTLVPMLIGGGVGSVLGGVIGAFIQAGARSGTHAGRRPGGFAGPFFPGGGFGGGGFGRGGGGFGGGFSGGGGGFGGGGASGSW